MAIPNVQRAGVITFGNAATPAAILSSEIVNVSFKISRSTTEKPATYGNPDISSVAGGVSREVTIEYLGDPSNATSFWSVLKSQIGTDDGLLYGTAKFSTAATSPTNKRYVFSCLVTEVMVGAKVNEIWGSSVTFPVVDYAEQSV